MKVVICFSAYFLNFNLNLHELKLFLLFLLFVSLFLNLLQYFKVEFQGLGGGRELLAFVLELLLKLTGQEIEAISRKERATSVIAFHVILLYLKASREVLALLSLIDEYISS